MVLYFRVENRVMNKKKISYSIFGVNLFFTVLYYRVGNKVSLKHFYSKLYFRVEIERDWRCP